MTPAVTAFGPAGDILMKDVVETLKIAESVWIGYIAVWCLQVIFQAPIMLCVKVNEHCHTDISLFSTRKRF